MGEDPSIPPACRLNNDSKFDQVPEKAEVTVGTVRSKIKNTAVCFNFRPVEDQTLSADGRNGWRRRDPERRNRSEGFSLDRFVRGKVAGVAGLEPVTSAVTGQRSNQLSYTPAKTAGAFSTRLRERVNTFLGLE